MVLLMETNRNYCFLSVISQKNSKNTFGKLILIYVNKQRLTQGKYYFCRRNYNVLRTKTTKW